MSANPAIAIKPGEMVMPFGSPGSEVLGQAMVQVFLNQVGVRHGPAIGLRGAALRQLFLAGIDAAAFLSAGASLR